MASCNGAQHTSGRRTRTGAGMELDTPEFLDHLAGIGAEAYLDMRQADMPDYEDWRDGNFTEDGPGSYVSREGQVYTNDELERIHGVLSEEAGDLLVNQLFEEPTPWLAE